MEEKSDSESMPVFSEGTEVMPLSEGTEEEVAASREEQHKALETISRFRESYREFREERENVFKIENPNILEISSLTDMWRQRPTRSEKFLLNLELTGCEFKGDLSPSTLERLLEPCPSIRARVDGKELEVRGALFHEGDNFYEGTAVGTQARSTS
jgi:hypothetical protein